MSMSLASKKVCLDIDSDLNVNSTVSLNILEPNILIDLNIYELESTSSMITYFVKDKRWGVYTEGVWHMLPKNFICTYIMSIYKDNLPKGIKFIYE